MGKNRKKALGKGSSDTRKGQNEQRKISATAANAKSLSKSLSKSLPKASVSSSAQGHDGKKALAKANEVGGSDDVWLSALISKQ